MRDKRRGRKKSNPFSKGKVNRLIDDLVHPLFETSKAFILVDGVLHGLAEQNLPLSVEKFVKYNLPELIKSKKSQRRTPGKRKRHYSCKLLVNGRYIFCKHKKAGPWCLKAGISRNRCPKLVISYK